MIVSCGPDVDPDSNLVWGHLVRVCGLERHRDLRPEWRETGFLGGEVKRK